jgi:hypothetical protein
LKHHPKLISFCNPVLFLLDMINIFSLSGFSCLTILCTGLFAVSEVGTNFHSPSHAGQEQERLGGGRWVARVGVACLSGRNLGQPAPGWVFQGPWESLLV